jgi:hypothetical protein
MAEFALKNGSWTYTIHSKLHLSKAHTIDLAILEATVRISNPPIQIWILLKKLV